MLPFEKLLAKEPIEFKNGIYYFDSHNHGDCFDKEDALEWDNGRLENNWNKQKFLDNPTIRYMLNAIISNSTEIIDLACGPGLGLIPSIKRLTPAFPCTATDANAMVLEHWKNWLDKNQPDSGINFAQFSILDMPFNDNSAPAFTSNIGLSSVRGGQTDYDIAVGEVYRCLVLGGYLYTIESEWMDIPSILQVFKKMNWQPWNIFTEKQTSWHDRFLAAGFEIVWEEISERRYFTADDNELGEASCKLQVPVGVKETAFVLRKK